MSMQQIYLVGSSHDLAFFIYSLVFYTPYLIDRWILTYRLLFRVLPFRSAQMGQIC
jgi:hypothetical protein